MLTVDELAIFLRASAARVRVELTEITREYLAEVAKDAQGLIGQERPEWQGLAEATIAEKQRLGFTGQVSGTDPLLRKGELRDSIKAEASEMAGGAEGVVGSTSKIGLFQEMGTAKIPPRPYTSIALQNSDRKAAEHFGQLGVHLTLPPIR